MKVCDISGSYGWEYEDHGFLGLLRRVEVDGRFRGAYSLHRHGYEGGLFD
jgi:hypothetical protein